MATIHVRSVPEPVLSALRERAEAHGRSMQHEVLAILESAIAEPDPGSESADVRHTTWRREDIYGDEGR